MLHFCLNEEPHKCNNLFFISYLNINLSNEKNLNERNQTYLQILEKEPKIIHVDVFSGISRFLLKTHEVVIMHTVTRTRRHHDK